VVAIFFRCFGDTAALGRIRGIWPPDGKTSAAVGLGFGLPAPDPIRREEARTLSKFAPRTTQFAVKWPFRAEPVAKRALNPGIPNARVYMVVIRPIHPGSP
jgi:hypothetical protein